MSDAEDLRLLIEISYMYYDENYKQSDIAKKFNISRSLVSKYLTKAREIGIVEFVIHDEFINVHYGLEQKLVSKFNIKTAICVDSNEDRTYQKKRVANAAGKYLSRQLKNDSTIAVAAGTTINEIAHSLTSSNQRPDVSFISMVGGVGENNKSMQSNFISDKLASKIGAQSKSLYAPVLVDSSEAKEVFINQSYIKNVLKDAVNADFALLGIGGKPINSSIATAYKEHLKSHNDFNHSEIVGDIGYNFINKDGELVNCDWNDRVISLQLEQIKKIPNVIGVVEGEDKVESIIAILSASLINTLIIDEKTAQLVLDYSIN